SMPARRPHHDISSRLQPPPPVFRAATAPSASPSCLLPLTARLSHWDGGRGMVLCPLLLLVKAFPSNTAATIANTQGISIIAPPRSIPKSPPTPEVQGM